MKKIYTIAASILVSTALFAQKVHVENTTMRFPTADDSDYLKQVEQKRARYFDNTKAPLDKVRVSHTDERVINSGLTFGGLFQIPCLGDSIAQIKFDNTGFMGVNTHSFGGIFDPTSDDFVLINNAIAERDTYYVDTVHLGIRYNMVNPPGIPDTLKVTYFIGDRSDDASNDAFFPLTFPAIPNSQVKGLNWAGSPNHGHHDGIQAPQSRDTYDYLLGIGDTTATGVRYISIPVGVSVPAGKLFGFNAYFIPSAPYTNADYYRLVDQNTGLSETMNSLQTFIRQEDSPNPSSFAYDPSSWGVTHTLGTETRYGAWTDPDDLFRNDFVSPGVAGAVLIDFTYSAESTVGINANNNVNAILGENYPNPFNGITKIKYSLTKASNVTFEVTDITGKQVMSVYAGQKTAGTYTLDLDANELKSGIYYYTIVTDSGRATKKMIVLQ